MIQGMQANGSELSAVLVPDLFVHHGVHVNMHACMAKYIAYVSINFFRF